MRFVNLTPHAINFFNLSDCTEQSGGRGYVVEPGTSCEKTILPSGKVARASQIAEYTDPVVVDGMSVPVCHMKYGNPVDLPEPADDTAYIVSAITANAAAASGRTVDDLYIVTGVVRDITGAIIGCTGLSKF